jgi:putative GTP pyrophosphokinase
VTDPTTVYSRRFDSYLREIAKRLETHVAELLHDVARIDRIAVRAKHPESFAKKASKNNKDGTPKYANPLAEIQDQIGARIIVFYKQDVESVTEIIRKYFQPIEAKDLIPESQWEFGYFGRHFVMPLPMDVVPKEIDAKDAPRFFELQIKTLFQHAWSEAEHDLGYKSKGPLANEDQRLLAFAASQGWGADRAFAELHERQSKKATA